MIYLDTTNSGRGGAPSGLNRVGARLRTELGAAALPVAWHRGRRAYFLAGGSRPVAWRAEDWLLTGELFGEAERPGFDAVVQKRPCRLAAIYHDAIPLKHPRITWPKSVARHPEYMTRLAAFDRVLADSAASAGDLVDFWRWQGRVARATVEALTLGADFNGGERIVRAPADTVSGTVPSLLCVGILEPRKNQEFLLEVCEELWARGRKFRLELVGRVNPHFGLPVAARVEALRRAGRAVAHWQGADDARMARLYAEARAAVFPTIAEGCGLPVIEALWMGVPCVCSDLPVLRENADRGGCMTVPVNDREAWVAALDRVMDDDDACWRQLVTEATTRKLPTWAETAQQILAALAG